MLCCRLKGILKTLDICRHEDAAESAAAGKRGVLLGPGGYPLRAEPQTASVLCTEPAEAEGAAQVNAEAATRLRGEAGAIAQRESAMRVSEGQARGTLGG